MGDMNKLNAIVWADIPVIDLDRAMAFYAAVLLREAKKIEMPGCTFAVLDHEGGNGACLVPSDDDVKPSAHGPLMYLNADGRLEAAEAQVVKRGGKVLKPKHSIGPHGFRSLILDSEGNRVALHSN